MTCNRGAIDDIYFVRWIQPDVSDAKQIIDDIKELRTQLGRQVRYIAVIGPDVDPPSEEVRTSMRKSIDDLLHHCASVHLVIEGKGFRRAMARSIGTSIFLLSKNRGRTFAHDSVEQALDRIGLAGGAAGDILERARKANLLNAPPT